MRCPFSVSGLTRLLGFGVLPEGAVKHAHADLATLRQLAAVLKVAAPEVEVVRNRHLFADRPQGTEVKNRVALEVKDVQYSGRGGPLNSVKDSERLDSCAFFAGCQRKPSDLANIRLRVVQDPMCTALRLPASKEMQLVSCEEARLLNLGAQGERHVLQRADAKRLSPPFKM
jgi:hypothetical protein